MCRIRPTTPPTSPSTATACPPHNTQPCTIARMFSGHNQVRYTATKLLDFDKYAQTTSRWRIVWVVLGTPLPPLLAVLLPPLLPLNDPTLGILENRGFCVHFVVVMAFTVFGGLLQGRAATSLPHSEYTTRQAVLVSLLSSSHLLGVTIAIAQLWRFPIPFTWATDFIPWVGCLVWSNILVFRTQLFSGALKEPVVSFLPSFVIQISQVLLYPAFSALFGFVNEPQQVLLTLLFPVIKFFMKKVLRIASRSLNEFSEEVSVSGVEICAAMYQSQIMQNTPSYIATAAIMGVDLVQGVASVKLFMDKKNRVVERHEIVSTAIQLLRSKRWVPRDTSATVIESETRTAIQPIPSMHSNSAVIEKTDQLFVPSAVKRVPPGLTQIVPVLAHETKRDGTDYGDEDNATVVKQAMEIMHAAESILLVEYFEVAIPVVNGIFLAIAGQMDSARYNPNLRPFHHDPKRLRAAMTSLVLYSLLQGLSVVAMNLVMWYRFRISGATHLAYVLERHRWSLQGKLISWLAVFFNFTVMHYGTDFTFKFDFSMPKGG